jgi:hypothetical protein
MGEISALSSIEKQKHECRDYADTAFARGHPNLGGLLRGATGREFSTSQLDLNAVSATQPNQSVYRDE